MSPKNIYLLSERVKIQTMLVRTRMAPSPTGEYHIGHIRTVLYDYAFAKKHDGQFIIRMEDTDQNRKVEGSAQRILDVIKMYGLSWDEGPDIGGPYAPYSQSERLETYKEYAEKLLVSGHAYRCFCTNERLEQMRKSQEEAGLPSTKYDRTCLKLTPDQVQANLSKDIPYVIRLKVPDNEIVSWDDLVLGTISINSNVLDDTVLIKSDGFPTYHMAVVVDDHIMKITYIMRGTDWVPSTPKHVLLYKAFGWEMPKTAHLPNLKEIGANKKLSKRYGSVQAIEFLQEGYLVEALLNFIMFLGWNPGTDKEIYSLEEFIQDFSIEKIHKTDLVAFDREKLLWMNGHYIRELSSTELLLKLKDWAKKFDMDLGTGSYDEVYITKVIDLVRERLKVLKDFQPLTTYFFTEPAVDTELLLKQTETKERSIEIITTFINTLNPLKADAWDVANLDSICHEIVAVKNYKPKEAFMTVRVAISGATATPPLFDMMAVLGKDVVLNRLNSCLKNLKK